MGESQGSQVEAVDGGLLLLAVEEMSLLEMRRAWSRSERVNGIHMRPRSNLASSPHLSNLIRHGRPEREAAAEGCAFGIGFD